MTINELSHDLRDAHRPERALNPSAVLDGLSKTFESKGREVNALKNVDLNIRAGEYVVVLGPSGCGKSTLLRCIAGLETPTHGTIQLLGNTVYDAARRVNMKVNERNVGMVFQNYALWPHMTVGKNVSYPLKMRKVRKAQQLARVAEVLRILDCEQLVQRLPVELSGGQQQRIALARALVYEPGILLLDEPLSNLDALLRISLRSELARLHRSLGFTALHITHDQEEALGLGDRVVLMREGEIEQIGVPAEVYRRPASPYAAKFLGVRNHVTAKPSGDSFVVEGARVRGSVGADLALHAGGLEVFARPSDTYIRRVQGIGDSRHEHVVSIEGTLAQVILGEGGRRQFVVEVAGSEWFCKDVEGLSVSEGERVEVCVPVDSLLLYGADGALLK